MREPVSVFMMVLCMNGYQGDDESAVLWYDPAYGLIQCVACIVRICCLKFNRVDIGGPPKEP